jgi:hypothetical protein
LGKKGELLKRESHKIIVIYRTVTMEVIEFGNWLKTTGEPYPAQTWEALIPGGKLQNSASG